MVAYCLSPISSFPHCSPLSSLRRVIIGSRLAAALGMRNNGGWTSIECIENMPKNNNEEEEAKRKPRWKYGNVKKRVNRHAYCIQRTSHWTHRCCGSARTIVLSIKVHAVAINPCQWHISNRCAFRIFSARAKKEENRNERMKMILAKRPTFRIDSPEK